MNNTYILYTAEAPDSLLSFVTFDSENGRWYGITEKESIQAALDHGILPKKPTSEKKDSGMNFGHYSYI